MKRNIHFTSDHHWFHSNILKFTDRQYKTLEEMHEDLIKKWNSVVKPNDIVYILGDNFWNTASASDCLNLNNKLRGKKWIVRGNHDKITLSQALDRGYTMMVEQAVVKIGKYQVRLSHYPYKYGFWKSLWSNLKYVLKHKRLPDLNRYNKNTKDDGMWLLHGHTHSENQVNGKQIHVGVDAWNGYPVSSNKILDIIQKS